MNKNLKKLLEQASIYAFDSRFVPEDNPRPVADVIQEKFAELIVAECVEICDNTTGTSYLNGWYAGKQIKKYFGVEE